jgi:hypothetical protein
MIRGIGIARIGSDEPPVPINAVVPSLLSDRVSGDVLAMLRKACGRAPLLRLAKLRSVLALLLSLIGLSSLKRCRRSDCGVVARETRPTIHRHGNRILRLRTWAVQPRSPCQTPGGATGVIERIQDRIRIEQELRAVIIASSDAPSDRKRRGTGNMEHHPVCRPPSRVP